MIIAQISDSHITSRNNKTYGIVPTAENLERCIEHINNQSLKPDVVMVTGDVTANGELDQVEHAASLLQQLDMPFYVIPGNHDNRDTLWAQFAHQACPSRSGEFINFIVDDYPIRIIGLDSIIHGNEGGMFCDARAEWLDASLAKDTVKPTVIFMHHPPLKLAMLETDKPEFIGGRLLASVLSRYDNIVRISCGHVHRAVSANWGKTFVTTAPSTGMSVALDLSLTLPSQYVLDAPAYQLHYLTDEGNLVSHTVTIDDDLTRYSFDDMPPC